MSTSPPVDKNISKRGRDEIDYDRNALVPPPLRRQKAFHKIDNMPDWDYDFFMEQLDLLLERLREMEEEEDNANQADEADQAHADRPTREGAE